MTGITIGILIGAAIVVIPYGVTKLVAWVCDTDDTIASLKQDCKWATRRIATLEKVEKQND